MKSSSTTLDNTPTVGAQIDVAQQPVQRVEAVVGGQVQVLPPPVLLGARPHPAPELLPQLVGVGHALGGVLDADLTRELLL
jgi:hypothetical protein